MRESRVRFSERELPVIDIYTGRVYEEGWGRAAGESGARVGSQRVSVGAVLDSLGPAVLSPLAIPNGPSAVTGPPLLDDGSLSGRVSGTTLLLVGRPGPSEIERAARAGATAVVVRAEDVDPDELVLAATRAGIALLAAGELLSWGDLYSMIRTLFTVYEPTEPVFVDLFELADRVARSAGGAVAIEDMNMRVVAYSSVAGQDIDELRLAGILGRRVPAEAVQAEEYLRVLRADGALWCLEPRDNAPRLAIGVTAHEQPYGTIWVVQGDGAPLAEDAPRILAEAADQAVPHLARLQLASDAVRRQRDDSIRRLVHGAGPAEALAAELGLPVRGHYRVVVFGSSGGPTDELDATVVADLVRSALVAYRIRAAVGVVEGVPGAIIAGDPDAELLERVLVESLGRAGQRHGAAWRAAMGRVVDRLERIIDSTIQAETVRDALPPAEPGTAPFVAYHDRMAPLLLLHAVAAGTEAAALLTEEPISIVREHDAANGTDYLRTLTAWASNHYDVPAAAEDLYLHPNTLRHRLGRIRGLLDLDDPDLRLALVLQLRLAALRRPGSGPLG